MASSRPALLGFQELNLGRAAYHLWHSQSTLSAYDDERLDLAGLGGTPWEEYALEDGTEAPPRPRLRHSPLEWQVEPVPLPSTELMIAWSSSGQPTLSDHEQALDELRQRERARAAAEEEQRQRDLVKHVAKIKRDRARARLVRFGNERLPAPAPKPRQRFVSMEQLAAFLEEDS